MIGSTTCIGSSFGDGKTPLERGLWLGPRKDTGNTARADVPGDMRRAPAEVWSYGGAAGAYDFVGEVMAAGAPAYLVQRARGLALLRPDGTIAWDLPALGIDTVVGVMDFTGEGNSQALVSLGKVGFALLDVASGRMLWRWAVLAGSMIIRCQLLAIHGGVRLFAFPPCDHAALGFCFDFAGTKGVPLLLWQRDYADKWWANYGPNLVLADMDRDGQVEVVVASKPAYIGVLDSDTGQVKFETRHEILDPCGFGRPDGPHIGRPYGLMHAVDLDGDGYPDIVLAPTQVEEYLAVLYNDGGKALKPVWSLFIEKDFPADLRELRAQPTSVADVNGDGKPELTVGLYNVGRQQQWRTLVLDPLVGFTHPLADFENKYFWGCFDIDGDGVAEVIATPVRERMITGASPLHALDVRRRLSAAIIEDARPVTVYSTIARFFPPRRPELTYYGALVEPIHIPGVGRRTGLVVRRGSVAGGEYLWRIENGDSLFEPFNPSAFARALILATRPDRAATVDWNLSNGAGAQQAGASARAPLVAAADGHHELVMALSDGTVVGGIPDLKRNGHFTRAWTIPGTMPALWLGPDGERLVCVADPNADIVTVYRPVAGQTSASPLCRLELPLPLNRNPMMNGVFPRHEYGMIPFGADRMRLFVPLRLGEHQLGCCLYGSAGELCWLDQEVGPHPRLAAVADLNGDGLPELVVDNHGMQYHYDLAGRRRLVAQVWGDAVPGRGDGCAHALPMVGPYGPGGALCVVMTPGYTAIEVQGASGERLALRPFAEAFEFAGRAAGIGRLRGDAQWDIGVVSALGVLHCIDLATCKDRWTFDLAMPASWPIACATGDLDGDGRDEFLLGLPDGRLVVVAEGDGNGRLLWELRYPVAVNDAIIADIDGDGRAEIIAETEDGYVRILK